MMTVEEIQKAIENKEIVYMVNSIGLLENIKVYPIKILKVELEDSYYIYHYQTQGKDINQNGIANSWQTNLVLFKRQKEAFEYMIDKVKGIANTNIKEINKAIDNVNKVAYKYGMSLAQIPYRTVIKGE